METKLPSQNPSEATITELSSAEEFIQRGWKFYVHGETLDSEKEFRKALVIDASSYEAAYGLGLTLKSRGRLEEARDIFEHTITILSTMTDVNNLARVTMMRGMAEAHLKMLEK